MNWELPPPRDVGLPAPADLVARREGAAAMLAGQPPFPGIEVRSEPAGAVECVTCQPPSPTSTVLYLHGGGYRLGAARSWTRFASSLAAAANTRVVIADYRLAPEHPFPAALHDAATAYQALVEQYGTPLVVAGDSAGGGLATALTVACVRAGGPVPDGLMLLSPWVDLTITAGTFTTRAATDQIFSGPTGQDAAAAYLMGIDPTDPLASPLFADLTGFPPSLVFAGGAETLLDDGLHLASRLAESGASVEGHFPAGMQHVWPTLFPELPESIAALSTMAHFIERVTVGRPKNEVPH